MSGVTGRLTPEDYSRVAARVAAWKAPVLLTHTNPDGDAIGCLVAMRSILRTLGTKPRPLLYEKPPPRCAWIVEQDPVEILGDAPQTVLAGADGILVMDTCTYNQLEPVADWLRQSRLPKVALDHHITRDFPADDFLIDERASSACLIVNDWARAAGWQLDDAARFALYMGIATDTGWFRFSNTDARTLEAAADLTEQGISPATLFEQMYQCESAARFRLLAATLSTLELHQDGQVALMAITEEMFARTEAQPQDTEDLINYPLQIGSVAVSVLLVERGEGVIRTSFRSKPPSASRPDVDVAAIAASFGGGGHRRAAGARVAGKLADVRGRILAGIDLASTARP